MFRQIDPKEPISQGDIIDGCPVMEMSPDAALTGDCSPRMWKSRVLVLSQACDLAQFNSSRVLVAVTRSARLLVESGILKESVIKNDVRRGRVYGWYFLPASPHEFGLEEQVVDLRDLHTIPRKVLEYLAADGKRPARLETPYREHLSQHFAVTYMRIGLPEPYETED